jgi:membrane protease YdiL (CAAX protease family)
VSRSWSVVDFILIWLAGQLGAAAAVVIGSALNVESTFLSTLVGQYVGIIGVLWILSRSKEDPELGFSIQGGDFGYIGLGLVLQLMASLAVLPLANLLFPDGPPRQNVTQGLLNADTLGLQVILVFAYVVVGPIAEELMYRGVLLRALRSRRKWTAIVVSSLVFAAVHLPGLPSNEIWSSVVVFLVPIFGLGVLLAWLTLRHGRLGPAIFLHSGWNLLAAFVLLLPEDVLEQVG